MLETTEPFITQQLERTVAEIMAPQKKFVNNKNVADIGKTKKSAEAVKKMATFAKKKVIKTAKATSIGKSRTASSVKKVTHKAAGAKKTSVIAGKKSELAAKKAKATSARKKVGVEASAKKASTTRAASKKTSTTSAAFEKNPGQNVLIISLGQYMVIWLACHCMVKCLIFQKVSIW